MVSYADKLAPDLSKTAFSTSSSEWDICWFSAAGIGGRWTWCMDGKKRRMGTIRRSRFLNLQFDGLGSSKCTSFGTERFAFWAIHPLVHTWFSSLYYSQEGVVRPSIEAMTCWLIDTYVVWGILWSRWRFVLWAVTLLVDHGVALG